ncbi:MAG: hypothetical protein GF416_04185 [Candidatus Altiarchaeales archaeon]|nr:hypothetical protein [Candidatus Altiarchaeales archaeon]MBD3416319.1 hypothetical protein [Candidatus Altiarchaeales archaeon]
MPSKSHEPVMYVSRDRRGTSVTHYRYDPEKGVYVNDWGQHLKVTGVLEPLELDAARSSVSDGGSPMGLMQIGDGTRKVAFEFVQTPLGGQELAQLDQLARHKIQNRGGDCEDLLFYDARTQEEIDSYFHDLDLRHAGDALYSFEMDLDLIECHGDSIVSPPFTHRLLERFQAPAGRYLKSIIPKDNVLQDMPDHMVHAIDVFRPPIMGYNERMEADPECFRGGINALGLLIDGQYGHNRFPISDEDRKKVPELLDEYLQVQRMRGYDPPSFRFFVSQLRAEPDYLLMWGKNAWIQTQETMVRHGLHPDMIRDFLHVRCQFSSRVDRDQIPKIQEESKKSTDLTPTDEDIRLFWAISGFLSGADPSFVPTAESQGEARMEIIEQKITEALNYRGDMVTAAVLYPGQIPGCDDDEALVGRMLSEMGQMETRFRSKKQGRRYELLAQNPRATMDLIKAWM